MPKEVPQPPFAPGALGQPAAQAAPAGAPLHEGYVTRAQAEQHEVLWLSLTALHKDAVALGAKKPTAPVTDALRIAAEGLLSDCAAFTRKRGERLPAAAPDLSGLAAQLGQALAALESWESHHTTWDTRFKCRIWSTNTGYLPIMRLKPPAEAIKFKRDDPEVIRAKLVRLMEARHRAAYEKGFAAGRAARQGEPAATPEPAPAPQTYPRLRWLD